MDILVPSLYESSEKGTHENKEGNEMGKSNVDLKRYFFNP